MKHHFENMKFLYGDKISVQMPNNIFSVLSKNTGNAGRAGFCYSYMVTVAFLYKYTHYIDLDEQTYIQNKDLKELLGYNAKSKSVDYMIKKDGLLDSLGLTKTTKDYPIRFYFSDEQINDIDIREFVTINDLTDCDDIKFIKSIVKNRNYTVKEPTFLIENYEDREYGTMYSIKDSHKITINEMFALLNGELNTLDFYLYGYFKSKLDGRPDKTRSLSLSIIHPEAKLEHTTFFRHLKVLEEKDYISVIHQGWGNNNANVYTLNGV